MPPPKETPRPLATRVFSREAIDALKPAGFECAAIGSNPERVRAMKHGCACLFERRPEGDYRLAAGPGYLIRGEIARLWDAGYQKFWLLGPPTEEPFNERRRPALTEQLGALSRFTEELKHALGLPSFYDESIGATTTTTAYDRLRGRGPFDSAPRRCSGQASGKPATDPRLR
ncbi:MAG: hypothetical protein ACE5HB_00725 [Terriglobia bacterium]